MLARTSCTLAMAAAYASLVQAANVNSTPEALNPQLTNTIPDAPGGPVLYYNGSGPVPPYNETSPVPVPITPFNASSSNETLAFYKEIISIVNGSNSTSKCSKCMAATDVMHQAAISQPVQNVVDLLILICNALPSFEDTIYAQTCYEEFSGIGDIGPYWAQLYAKMSNDTGDYEAWCWFYDQCSHPPTIEIDEGLYFSPKPASAEIAPPRSGESINVVHLSDWHLDSRYDIGSEANCTDYLCCRPYSTNTVLDTDSQNASVPASRFGYLYCDAPPDLALSAFSTMPQFLNLSDVAFTIFTGDIVSHDNDDQLSRAYVEYEEEVTYKVFKAQMPDIPIYPTLGNHDSLPEAYNTQNVLNPTSSLSSNAMSWNYELLSSMWLTDEWINSSEAAYAATHYGAYAHTTPQGLRIISINTDFWYVDNIFNYWNFTNPDTSGVLKFLISELEACEAKGQRAWIIGHVLSGYDGSNALSNPTALFYSIVRRFSPATIAGIFFGHTHEDQLEIFYDFLPNSTANGSSIRDTSLVDYNKPLMVALIGPSITPLTGLNAGYPLYQIDAKTFEVTGIQTYFANVSDANSWTTPVWQFEYDARETYDPTGAWPKDAPLNASFWHGVTEQMLVNQTVVELYNLYETKSSAVTENCTSKACAVQKVCYLRSGSAELGYACPYTDGPY